MKKYLSSKSLFWTVLFLFRTVVNPWLLQTFFSPDEYFQSLQVAHHHVFCVGTPLTWEWTIEAPIRGYLHVMPFMLLYWLLRLCALGHSLPLLLVLAPRMLQGVMQFACDVFLYRLCALLFPQQIAGRSGNSVALYGLLCQVVNWFTFYCGARTFGNSMETTISVVGIYYYYCSVLNKDENGLLRQWWRWLFFSGLGIVIRPTNALFWIPVAAHALIRVFKHTSNGYLGSAKALGHAIVMGMMPIVTFWIVVSVAIDSFFYGKTVFVMWNFLKFNVIENRAAVYGVQPWHWYLSQGLPVMMLSMIPLFIVSLWYGRQSGDRFSYPLLPLVIIAFLNGTYSLFAHKEFRFIFPILPLCMMYCGHGLAHLHRIWLKKRILFKTTVMLILMTNALAAAYFSLVHLRAPIDAMYLLQKRTHDAPTLQSIHFWLPCHHTPGRTHVHGSNVELHTLDCSPDFTGDPNHVDEADRFFSNPGRFIQENLTALPPPDYLVMYERLMLENNSVRDYLSNHRYAIISRLFHSHFPEVLDRRMSTHMLILKRPNTMQS